MDGDDEQQTAGPPSFEPPPSFGSAPSFEPPAPQGAPASFGSAPLPPTAVPPPGLGQAPVPEPPPAVPSSGGSGGGFGLLLGRRPGDGERPAPTLVSMLAVGAGLLVAAGLFFFLGELDGYDQRHTGLAISLLFVALGVAISTINRSSRAATAGVALSLVAIVPLTIYLFANADLFADLSGGEVEGNVFDGIRGVVTLMLGTAMVLWLAGYLLGPGRRYGAYLAGALLALWAIPMFNIQVTALEDTVSPFGSVTFEPVPTDPGFDSGFDSSDPSFDDPSFDEFDSSFDEGTLFQEPDVPDPSTKLGMVSLAFGAAYLGLAAWRDRRGDARMATALLAPGLFILVDALGLLTGHVGWVGWGLLTMVVGGGILAVGLRAQRRASSWIGIAVATIGLGSLVVEGLRDSARAIGGVLTLLGVVIALVVGRAAARGGADGEAEPPAEPLPPVDSPGAHLGTQVGAPDGPWAPPGGGGSAAATPF